MKSLFEQKGGTYTKVGDYYLPNLSAAGDNYKIGKYGRARRNYLKKHRESEYTALMITGKLHSQLRDVDVKAQKILECFIKDAEKSAPDKATHQMEWVGHMNNAKACAEEVINQKLIYVSR